MKEKSLLGSGQKAWCGGGDHPKTYCNMSHGELMLSLVWATLWSRVFCAFFFPFKPQRSSIALSCPWSSTSVPLSVWNTLLFPLSLSPSTFHLFSFIPFIILTIAWSKKTSMISKPGWWLQKNSMASWTYHITASVTLFWNDLFSCLQTLC